MTGPRRIEIHLDAVTVDRAVVDRAADDGDTDLATAQAFARAVEQRVQLLLAGQESPRGQRRRGPAGRTAAAIVAAMGRPTGETW